MSEVDRSLLSQEVLELLDDGEGHFRNDPLGYIILPRKYLRYILSDPTEDKINKYIQKAYEEFNQEYKITSEKAISQIASLVSIGRPETLYSLSPEEKFEIVKATAEKVLKEKSTLFTKRIYMNHILLNPFWDDVVFELRHNGRHFFCLDSFNVIDLIKALGYSETTETININGDELEVHWKKDLKKKQEEK